MNIELPKGMILLDVRIIKREPFADLWCHLLAILLDCSFLQ